MKLERYEFKASEGSSSFEFVSEGKNGRVIKEVRFRQYKYPDTYNLALGDINPETSYFDDLVVTNNGDMEKVLATVVSIVSSFTEIHPEVWVWATGSSESRIRLYRIYISKYLDIVRENFNVLGYLQTGWEEYAKGKNYTEFAVQRKIQ